MSDSDSSNSDSCNSDQRDGDSNDSDRSDSDSYDQKLGENKVHYTRAAVSEEIQEAWKHRNHKYIYLKIPHTGHTESL